MLRVSRYRGSRNDASVWAFTLSVEIHVRGKLSTIVNRPQDPLNQYLIKQVSFDFTPELREHIRPECEGRPDLIQQLA